MIYTSGLATSLAMVMHDCCCTAATTADAGAASATTTTTIAALLLRQRQRWLLLRLQLQLQLLQLLLPVLVSTTGTHIVRRCSVIDGPCKCEPPRGRQHRRTIALHHLYGRTAARSAGRKDGRVAPFVRTLRGRQDRRAGAWRHL